VNPDTIPEEVADFVVKHIPSVRVLEAVLFLAKDPDRSWTAMEISTELRCDADVLARDLAILSQDHVVSMKQGNAQLLYAAAPAGSQAHEAAIELLQFYKTHWLRIIELVYSDRREDGLKSFADAFRLTKARRSEKP